MSKVSYKPHYSGIEEKKHGYINGWKNVVYFIALAAIPLFFLTLTLISTKEDYFNGWAFSFTFISAFIFLVYMIVFIPDSDKYKPYVFPEYDHSTYRLYHFETKNMTNVIYQKAYDDCVEEIKNGDFVTDAWEKIFKDLNVELYEIEQQEKQKKIAIDRLDYAKVLKDANELYLGK